MILTVDILVVIDNKDVLLIRRAKPPFQDRLVMPGGHVEKEESLREAAVRELEEEVGLTASPEELVQGPTLDTPGRDPRPGHRVSTVFLLHTTRAAVSHAVAASDACEIIVRPIASLCAKEMGFDHWIAIRWGKHESA